MADKATAEPEAMVPREVATSIQSASLQFLSFYPEIVRNKQAALQHGDYRLTSRGKLPLGVMVSDDPAFSLVWGQYLSNTKDGINTVVFRLTRQDYPDAYALLSSLRDACKDQDFAAGQASALKELSTRRDLEAARQPRAQAK